MSPLLQHGVLSREFVELMGHCNTIQAQYRERNVERIQRQLKISEYCRPDWGLMVGLCQGSRSCTVDFLRSAWNSCAITRSDHIDLGSSVSKDLGEASFTVLGDQPTMSALLQINREL